VLQNLQRTIPDALHTVEACVRVDTTTLIAPVRAYVPLPVALNYQCRVLLLVRRKQALKQLVRQDVLQAVPRPKPFNCE
jgi:hypothetical protein